MQVRGDVEKASVAVDGDGGGLAAPAVGDGYELGVGGQVNFAEMDGENAP
jgi:hypothetical protein